MQLDLSCRVFLDNVAAESELINGNLVILYKQQLDAAFDLFVNCGVTWQPEVAQKTEKTLF